MTLLLPHHPLNPARPAMHRKTEKDRQLADGREWGGGVGGGKSCDREKAWSSMNHSILSGTGNLAGKGCIFCFRENLSKHEKVKNGFYNSNSAPGKKL